MKKNLVDYIIKRFDGEIVVPNQWRVDGSNGKRYTVNWDKYHRNYSVPVWVILIEEGVNILHKLVIHLKNVLE